MRILDLERAEASDADAHKLAFILNAKGWADEQEISAAAFQALATQIQK